jgi:hypothetical protein
MLWLCSPKSQRGTEYFSPSELMKIPDILTVEDPASCRRKQIQSDAAKETSRLWAKKFV